MGKTSVSRQHRTRKKSRSGAFTRSLRVEPLEDRRLLASAPGDFNDNDIVDAADYTLWQDAVGTNTPLANDDQLGTPIGNAHYALWKANFGRVAPVNTPPVAVDDAVSTAEDTPLTVAGPGVLGNDTDIDGDALTATLDNAPASGTAVIGADGGLSYTPHANFNGVDTFTYIVTDGAATSAPATVTVTVTAVNDAPVANPDSYNALEDTPLTVNSLLGVLTNDTDIESDALRAELVTQATNGLVKLEGNGAFTYNPTTAHFHGDDTFTYTASDGEFVTEAATVTVTVAPVNDAPVANPDSYNAIEDTTLLVAAGQGVLFNDNDDAHPGTTLTAVVATQATNGTVELAADGAFTWTPTTAHFNGTDSFTYTATDGEFVTEAATVTVTVAPVNDAPVANPDSYNAIEDTLLTVAAEQGVLFNDDDDAHAGGTLTAKLATQATNGVVTLEGNGAFTYNPTTAHFHGTDTFTYTATDGAATSAPATVTVTVTAVPTASWNFDEGAGTVVGDGTGSGNTGQIDGASWTEGYAGSALEFDGIDDRVLLGTGPSLEGLTDFTVMAMVRTTATSGGILIQQRNGGYNGEYILKVNADGRVNFWMYGDSRYQFNITSAEAINDGQWHHVAAGRNGDDGFLYIDGQLAATGSGSVVNLRSYIAMGIGADIRNNGQYFLGTIDEVALYEFAFSAEEIAELAL